MAATIITAVGYSAAFVLQIYRNTRLYKKFTIRDKTTLMGKDIQGWTILFTVKPPGSTDENDDAALIKINIVIPAIDANGALGIFYLDVPDESADIPSGKYDCDFIYIAGGERNPLLKFKAKVTENVTKRESVI
jgi:hypothetical protein